MKVFLRPSVRAAGHDEVGAPHGTEHTMDWRNEAACRDVDPDLFFPIGTTGIAVEHVDAAKRICATCMVREPCLEFALASNQDAGVWGGLTEDERRTLKRARQRRRRLVS